MLRRILWPLCFIAVEAHADSLLLDLPGCRWLLIGSDLQIFLDHHSIGLSVESDVKEGTDVIRRSGFEAVYWSWELIFGGALGEGSGSCALEAGAPDAILRCDGAG